MPYIENPKTKGSGIICAIPQKGECPNKCDDCFFQSGRSYLEPLEENLPNMPDYDSINDMYNRIVRVNDGNDSNVDREKVIKDTGRYYHKFYNTAIPNLDFDAPVVLTINPADMTDNNWYKIKPPKNLMAVRIRVNLWNLYTVVKPAVEYYSKHEIPIFLTFMAYHTQSVPEKYKDKYVFKKRTLNSYWVIKTEHWEVIMSMFEYNPWVYSCSKVEGDKAIRACHRCGNCLREYFYTMEKMRS